MYSQMHEGKYNNNYNVILFINKIVRRKNLFDELFTIGQ